MGATGACSHTSFVTLTSSDWDSRTVEVPRAVLYLTDLVSGDGPDVVDVSDKRLDRFGWEDAVRFMAAYHEWLTSDERDRRFRAMPDVRAHKHAQWPAVVLTELPWTTSTLKHLMGSTPDDDWYLVEPLGDVPVKHEVERSFEVLDSLFARKFDAESVRAATKKFIDAFETFSDSAADRVHSVCYTMARYSIAPACRVLARSGLFFVKPDLVLRMLAFGTPSTEVLRVLWNSKSFTAADVLADDCKLFREALEHTSHLPTIEFFFTVGILDRTTATTCRWGEPFRLALLKGNLAVIEFLWAQGVRPTDPRGDGVISELLIQGLGMKQHFHVIRWLHEHEVPIDVEHGLGLIEAGRHRHVEGLEFFWRLMKDRPDIGERLATAYDYMCREPRHQKPIEPAVRAFRRFAAEKHMPELADATTSSSHWVCWATEADFV